MKEYTTIKLKGGTVIRFPMDAAANCAGLQPFMNALNSAQVWDDETEEWANNCIRGMEVEYDEA